MGLFYADSEDVASRKGGFSIADADPNRMMQNHIEAEFYLTFILTNSGNFHEKHQAQKELDIAQKKIKFWRKHPEYSQDEEMKFRNIEKRRWNTK